MNAPHVHKRKSAEELQRLLSASAERLLELLLCLSYSLPSTLVLVVFSVEAQRVIRVQGDEMTMLSVMIMRLKAAVQREADRQSLNLEDRRRLADRWRGAKCLLPAVSAFK